MVDGERIVASEVEIGYLHRCFEKMAETHTWQQVIPYTDRLNYCSSFINNVGYCRTVEQMLGIEVPPRGVWARTILSEFSRIMDHCVANGSTLVDAGALTNFWYFFQPREEIYGLLESLCGARLIRPGEATLLEAAQRVGNLAWALRGMADGIERRIAAGLKPDVTSVASLFISRWDVAVTGKAPESLRGQLGIAIAQRTYVAYRNLLGATRWQRIFNFGARPQRLLWASTGTKDPNLSDTLYVQSLTAPFTINTMPEPTLKAFADHGRIESMLPADGGNCEEVLTKFTKAGIDLDALAMQLQDEGAKAFTKSWTDLMERIASKSEMLKKAG
jgi:hypothetical protein